MQFVEIEDVVKRVGRRTFRLEVNPSNQNKEVRVLDTKTGKIKKITLLLKVLKKIEKKCSL